MTANRPYSTRPCHHTLQDVTGGAVQEFVCILDDGHLVDHQDDEAREWPLQCCDTDLHEVMRPVLAIIGEGPPREFCASCAGDLIRHLNRRLKAVASSSRPLNACVCIVVGESECPIHGGAS